MQTNVPLLYTPSSAVLCCGLGNVNARSATFSTGTMRKDGKPTCACLPIKQHKATLRLAEQTNHDRIKVPPFSHSIATQTPAPVPTEICFPPNISSLVAFCSHLLFPLTPPHSLKRWHRAAPKQIVFFICAFSRPAESIRFFYGRARGTLSKKKAKKENKTAISFQQPSVD